MLANASAPANPFPFPTAAVPLSPEARQALLPSRLSRPWLTAALLERALARLDLSCLAPLYRRRGSLPFCPRLMLLLALFCISDGLPSPSDWALMANRDGPCRWLVWGIEPSPSACYSFRERLGPEVLDEFNSQALALALDDGLTTAARGAIDGTLVEADASRHRLLNSTRLRRGLEALGHQQAAPPAPAAAPPAAEAAPPPVAGPAPPSPAAMAPEGGSVRMAQQITGQDVTPVIMPAVTPATPSPAEAGQAKRPPVRLGHTQAGRQLQLQRWRRAEDELKKRQEHNQQKRAGKRKQQDKVLVSPSDPEAAVGRDKRGVYRALYNAQLVADLDSDLMLGYEVLPQQNDNGLLPLMLARCERLLGHKLELTLVDAGYTGGQELAGAEQAGTEVLGPPAGQGADGAKKKQKQLAKGEFKYDEARDCYSCPEGKALQRVGQSRQKRSGVELVVLTEYRNKEGDCQGCPRKQECCPKSKRGRSISRSEHEGAVERLRERMGRAENRRLYKRRAATVERLFGDAKEQRGLTRVSGRGLDKARIQLALTVLQHNLRVLAGGRPAPRPTSPAPPPGGPGP